MKPGRKPTREEIAAAENKRVPDVIAPGLRVLFCGINPGLYSGATGHHFARPGNRFWPALHRAGFTHRELSPFEERELLDDGCGITNLVNRATRGASDLTADQLRRGGRRLVKKVRRYRPRCLAVLGIDAFRKAFDASDVEVGRHAGGIDATMLWVLPNPSGLNAHYQLDDLVRELRRLRKAVEG